VTLKRLNDLVSTLKIPVRSTEKQKYLGKEALHYITNLKHDKTFPLKSVGGGEASTITINDGTKVTLPALFYLRS
jgi:hypothetical protein